MGRAAKGQARLSGRASPPTQFLMATNSLSACCESGGRSLAESGPAAPAQAPVYCPVYESRLLATARHELSSAAALGVYGGPYAGSQGYSNYVTYGSEASAFYSLVSPEGGPHPRSAFVHAPVPLSRTRTAGGAQERSARRRRAHERGPGLGLTGQWLSGSKHRLF